MKAASDPPIWDWLPEDQALIDEAVRKVHELDKEGVPLNDTRRVLHVAEDTRRSWELRGMKVTHIAGLKVV